jgi:DNA-binding SARP family transcriptional activator
VEFRILGPLEVLEDGRPVALGRLKERMVLAVLLLHANKFVSRERLIDELWGVAPPATARKAVNVYVSKLRKTLTVNSDDPIATAEGGYRLVVDTDLLDAERLGSLVAEARERLSAGEPEPALQLLKQALALWRGPTLAGLQLESHGRDEVAQLDELRLAVLMDRIDCELTLGRQEHALGELNLLVREHPLRERLRAQQMLALYRADRQAEALDAYAEARRTLVDDLGIEPSEALQRLQQAILRHDPSLETPEGTAAVNGIAPGAAAPQPTPTTVLEVGGPGTRRRFRPRRWQLALAALVILAASAAAVVVFSTSAAATPHVVPDSLVRIDPTGKIVSVTPVGVEPQQIAVTPSGIWTSDLTENAVTRYDLRTHKAQTLGTPPEPFNVVANAGNAWISSLRSSSTITRFAAFGTGPSAGWGSLDPSDTSNIHLPPPGAVSLALGAGYLWAVAGPKTTPGTDDRVWLVDPASNRVVRLLRLGRQTTSIDFGEGAAWIGAFASERKILSTSPPWTRASWLFSVKFGAAGPRVQSYRLETGDTSGPSAVAVGYGKVWVLTCGNCNIGVDNQKLLEFDPDTGQVVKRIPLGSRNPNALAVGAGSVWVANQVDASVTQRDPKTGRIVRTIHVGDPANAAICGIAAGRDALWVAVGNRHCESSGG